MKEHRKVAAYGVCRSDSGILLTRYVDQHSNDRWWTLPGGNLEYAEDPISSVEREFTEETGLDIAVNSLLGIGSRTHRVPWNAPNDTWLHTIAIYYRVTPVGGTFQNEVAGSTDQVAWFNDEGIRSLERAVIVDVALELDERRPADGSAAAIALKPGVRE